jgi:acetyl coenzyme A synthetase (ADP forming)-like protein
MHAALQPRFIHLPYQDSADSGRLLLRDGSTAQLRHAHPDDREALAQFFRNLSAESRYRRFLSASTPGPELITRLAAENDQTSALTLVVTRTNSHGTHIIATGSCLARDARTAEVALAVAEDFRDKGLGTLLLERLALLAVRNGFTRLWALTGADNAPMLRVFRDSGFAVRERPNGSEVEIDLSVIPTERSVAHAETCDRVATIASLMPLFRPNAVAVVGASRDHNAIGRHVLDGLLRGGFRGPIYPINPKAREIAGLRAFPSMRELPGPVDLAVIAVPATAVPAVVDDCAARGVRGLVVISAGFAEAGPEGSARQKALVEQVRGYGMRLVGPNCLGLINAGASARLNASFAPALPSAGRIAMSSQSGAVGLAALNAADRYGLGFSTFVSVGNKADVSGNDLLQYWEDDPDTDVILLYLESFGNPRRFARIARRVARRKPVVVLHSGVTRAGSRAAGSHTAALATNAATAEAMFRQTGVIRAGSLEELFDLALLLGDQPLPTGKRVAIVTNAGGPGILATDACEASGLSVPEPSPELRAKLASLLPGAASIGNPFDLIASAGPQAFQQAIEAVLTCREFDSVLVLFTPVGLADPADVNKAIVAGVAAARAGGAKGPVLVCLLGQDEHRSHITCGNERIPCYPFPETPARVLGKVAEYAVWKNRPPEQVPDFPDLDLRTARAVCRHAIGQRGAGWLSAEEVGAVLGAVRLPLVPVEFARTADEASASATRLGFPVAVKLASQQIVHKTDVGGVRLGLSDANAVRRAFEEIRAKVEGNPPGAMDGVIVQPMVRGGTEVMVGVTHDPLFGPVIAFGLGGIFVEVLADVCLRVAPLTDRDAADMVRGIRGFRLLEGFRGHPPADIAALEEVLLRVSRLAEEIPEIAEIDLNPVFAFPPERGCLVADARIRVRSSQEL